jgi:acyl dehydratase
MMSSTSTTGTKNRVVVSGRSGLTGLVGAQIGPSSWVEIDQDRVNRFGVATDDMQWIHVDPERAAEGPFGGPIAHGYLTLSLVPVTMSQLIEVEGFSLVVNYGSDRVRYPAPVPVGSQVRATAVVDEVAEVTGGVQAAVTLTFECTQSTKPVCVASVLVRYYD